MGATIVNNSHHQLLKLGQNLEFSYVERGAPDRPAIVLLHGYSDSWRSYAPLMTALPYRYRLVAVSFRGHGDSSKPPYGYDIATFALDVIALLDALGIEHAVFVGHSMGSLVAQRIALDHPDRVLKLVLIGAFAGLAGNEAVQALWRDDVSHMRGAADEEFVRSFQQSSIAVEVPQAFVDGVVAESLKVPAHVWQSTLRSLLRDDHTDRLHEILAPTLIIWGDQDTFATRADQDQLTLGLPNARLSIHVGIGHAPNWENPARVAREIERFVDERGILAAE
jgi:pimeloyl-ACP methyl ester carboxylesterase